MVWRCCCYLVTFVVIGPQGEREKLKKDFLKHQKKFEDYDVVVTTYDMVLADEVPFIYLFYFCFCFVIGRVGFKVSPGGTSFSMSVSGSRARRRWLGSPFGSCVP